ncbi:MAG: hypothetical protein ACYTAS_17200, partial [Planctomycetota bacterium]
AAAPDHDVVVLGVYVSLHNSNSGKSFKPFNIPANLVLSTEFSCLSGSQGDIRQVLDCEMPDS